MMDEIFSIYEKIYNVAFKILDWVWDIDENSNMEIIQALGVTIGIILFEYLYFTKADEVRLLFASLIILPGAIFGAIVSGLLYFVFMLIVLALIVAFLAFITLVPIAAIIGLTIYILYSIKI